jgi:hypothetical protein
MRFIEEITKEEIEKVNEILEKEYYFHKSSPIKNATDLEYQCFSKSHAIFSGFGVVKVYEYLKSVGIDIFKQKNEYKTSKEWQILHPEIKVLDPDGWDRRNFQYSWYEETISFKEYQYRLMGSTCEGAIGKLNNK